jgi:hypothetical protein
MQIQGKHLVFGTAAAWIIANAFNLSVAAGWFSSTPDVLLWVMWFGGIAALLIFLFLHPVHGSLSRWARRTTLMLGLMAYIGAGAAVGSLVGASVYVLKVASKRNQPPSIPAVSKDNTTPNPNPAEGANTSKPGGAHHNIQQSGKNNIAQIGNNNTATINEVPPDRTWHPGATEVANLCQVPYRVHIGHINDPEAARFAERIAKVLADCGWAVDLGPATYPHSFNGVWIKSNTLDHPAAVAFERAFSPVGKSADPEVPVDWGLVVHVGAQGRPQGGPVGASSVNLSTYSNFKQR